MGTGALLINSAANSPAVTEVFDGNLMVGDADHPTATISNVYVAPTNNFYGAGGTVSGYGIISDSLSNVGNVRPGNVHGGIGTLTVSSGNYLQSYNGPVGTLTIELNPTTASKLVIASGSANLAERWLSCRMPVITQQLQNIKF